MDEYGMARMHSEELLRAAAEARLAGEARPPAGRSVRRAVSRLLAAVKVRPGQQRRPAAASRHSAVAR